VTYSAPGYQSVTINNLVITAGTGIEQNVTLQPLAPTSNFIADHTDGCGGVVAFTDLTGSANSWTWDFGDGQTSIEQHPVHSYAQSGNYTVSLSVSNCAGADEEIKVSYINVNVMELPAVAQDSFSVCSPQSFDLVATGTGNLAWYGAPVGGNALAIGESFTTPLLTSSATYYVENQVDLGSATVGSSNSQANGGYYTAGAYHYLVFDALSSFTLVSVQVNANSAGNRTIDLRDNAGNVLQSVTVNIPQGVSTVNLGFTIPVGTGYQLGTAGGNNLWRNNAQSAYPYTLDGVVSIFGNSANNAAYYYYFYQWNISQTCSSARVPVTITVGSSIAPEVVLTQSTPEICSGSPITFIASASNVTNPTYSWTIDGIPAPSTMSSLTWATPSDAVIVCTVEDINNCSGTTVASSQLNITVTPTPSVPVVVQVGNTLSVDATSGIQWYLNGSPIAGANGPQYAPTASGDYSVIVSNGSCESAMSNTIGYTVTQLIEEEMTGMLLYPNPAVNELNLITPYSMGFEWRIYNSLGQCIDKGQNMSSSMLLSVASFEKGVYSLLIVGQDTHVKQFVVEK
jgi:PKD repeat protein